MSTDQEFFDIIHGIQQTDPKFGKYKERKVPKQRGRYDPVLMGLASGALFAALLDDTLPLQSVFIALACVLFILGFANFLLPQNKVVHNPFKAIYKNNKGSANTANNAGTED